LDSSSASSSEDADSSSLSDKQYLTDATGARTEEIAVDTSSASSSEESSSLSDKTNRTEDITTGAGLLTEEIAVGLSGTAAKQTVADSPLSTRCLLDIPKINFRCSGGVGFDAWGGFDLTPMVVSLSSTTDSSGGRRLSVGFDFFDAKV